MADRTGKKAVKAGESRRVKALARLAEMTGRLCWHETGKKGEGRSQKCRKISPNVEQIGGR